MANEVELSHRCIAVLCLRVCLLAILALNVNLQSHGRDEFRQTTIPSVLGLA